MIALGDRLLFAHDNKVILATVKELRINNEVRQELLLTAPTEVGIQFDKRIKKGAAICALRDQQTAPYQVLQTVQQRKEDIIGAITDRFRKLTFVTDDGTSAILEGIDSTDFDLPTITTMSDGYAHLLLTARLTFTAIVARKAPALADSDAEPDEPAAVETVQSTVSIPVICHMRFESLTALADAAHTSIDIAQLNSGENVIVVT